MLGSAHTEGKARTPPSLFPAQIPNDLRRRSQCVAWRYGPLRANGKRSKVPIDPRTGRPASVTNPQTWADFDTALQFVHQHPDHGVGFVFTANDPFAGIDLDGCRNPDTGEIEPWALAILDGLATYAEVSPSGTGVKAIIVGVLPGPGRHVGNIEVYDRGRFFTLTGDVLAKYPTTTPQDRQAELVTLYGSLLPKQQQAPRSQQTDAVLTDRAMACKRTGAKFKALWSGDTGAYASASEADLALCSLLAFWTGPSPASIDALFRQSGLMREKWDKRHHGDGQTYGQGTIAKALEGRTAFYRGARKGEPCPPCSALHPHVCVVVQNVADKDGCPVRFSTRRPCPRFSPRKHLVSRSTGAELGMRFSRKRWSCPVCALGRKQGWLERLYAGIRRHNISQLYTWQGESRDWATAHRAIRRAGGKFLKVLIGPQRDQVVVISTVERAGARAIDPVRALELLAESLRLIPLTYGPVTCSEKWLPTHPSRPSGAMPATSRPAISTSTPPSRPKPTPAVSRPRSSNQESRLGGPFRATCPRPSGNASAGGFSATSCLPQQDRRTPITCNPESTP